MNKEDELQLFRKVCGCSKIVTNDHVNVVLGNTVSSGNFNQGVSRAKFKEYIKIKKTEFEKWKI